MFSLTRLRREGYFSEPLITGRWRQHLRSQADWSAHLWSVLMFQAWHGDLSTRSHPRPRERRVTPTPALYARSRL